MASKNALIDLQTLNALAEAAYMYRMRYEGHKFIAGEDSPFHWDNLGINRQCLEMECLSAALAKLKELLDKETDNEQTG